MNRFTTAALCAAITCASGTQAATPTVTTDAFEAEPAYYVRESVEISNHYVFPAGPMVDGVTILTRDVQNRVVRIEVASDALEPNTAYSIWLAAFNRPDKCAVPHACTGADSANPEVKGSIFWGGGILSDANGHGSTSMVLQPGRTHRELFGPEPRSDIGLQYIRLAEIHVVLRSHGPIGVAGSIADQIGTAGVACPDTGCFNAFFSAHSVLQ